MKFSSGLAWVIVALLSNQALASSWNGRIFRAADVSEINATSLVEELSTANQIILGEKHYTPAVQQTQADIIQNVVLHTGKNGNFTTGWEFLTASEQPMIQALFGQFISGEITAKYFLDVTQGANEDNYSYAPLLEVTKALGGKFVATNLSRKEVGPVAKYGIGAADPTLIPAGFEMGSQGYHDRFWEFMSQSGHATPQMIENYYAAQCLKDDVMAFNLINATDHSLKFLIVGSFHTDYLDGTVARLKVRAPSLRTLTVRIIDASDYAESELMPEINSPKYGPVADYVVFVNEPAQTELNGLQLRLDRIRKLLDAEALEERF